MLRFLRAETYNSQTINRQVQHKDRAYVGVKLAFVRLDLAEKAEGGGQLQDSDQWQAIAVWHPAYACCKSPCVFQFTSWTRQLLARSKIVSNLSLLDLCTHWFHSVIQKNDLLAIKMNDPAMFPMDITPYPLNPEWKREAYLMDAKQFFMMHFLPDAHGRPGSLQFTLGKRSNECTGQG